MVYKVRPLNGEHVNEYQFRTKNGNQFVAKLPTGIYRLQNMIEDKFGATTAVGFGNTYFEVRPGEILYIGQMVANLQRTSPKNVRVSAVDETVSYDSGTVRLAVKNRKELDLKALAPVHGFDVSQVKTEIMGPARKDKVQRLMQLGG